MSIDCYCKGHENYYECPMNYSGLKPRYPVPVIPTRVLLYDDMVLIEQLHTLGWHCIIGWDKLGLF